MPRLLLAPLVCGLMLALAPTARGCPLPLPETTLSIGGATLVAEVAATHVSRYCGLSLRDALAPGRGMLFVFRDAGTRHFTMRDTRVPLSIAFLDEARRIIDVQKMNPGPAEVLYASAAPARYALEVRQGWFDEHGISTGDRAEFVLSVVLRVE